jgi:hypothetical protein
MEVRRVEVRGSWLGLRRRQLVELEDLPWWPAPWRDAGTSFLALALRLGGQAVPVAARIEAMLARTGETVVLDMGSGGGGPMAVVASALSRPDTRVHLTDLHPNVAAFEDIARQAAGRVSFSAVAVDATSVAPELAGLRTMINAFHHLPPEAAQAVLQSAVDGGRPITVIEVVSRSPLTLLSLLFAPLSFALTFPLQRPVRLGNAFFTYVVPVLPAFVLWDGIVSWLRIYDPDELEAMVRQLRGADDWSWEVGSFRLGDAPVWGVYLEGCPPAAGLAEQQRRAADQ